MKNKEKLDTKVLEIEEEYKKIAQELGVPVSRVRKLANLGINIRILPYIAKRSSVIDL